MQMRKSRVLQKLRAGELVSCVKMNLSCARTSELAAALGFDCIWIDMEHTAADWSEVEKHIMAAKTRDKDVMVRVTRGSYSDYIRPLELDAAGIMVPHIMSVEDAKQVARTTRFHPVGRRPVDGGNADGIYCNIPFLEYIKQANEQRFVVVQIEDPEPLDDLDVIASVEGIDMLFFGPGDFSHSIGTPADFQNPKVIETRKRVAEVARAHGKYAGTIGGLGDLDNFFEMGYRFISIGADVLALGPYFKEIVSAFEDHKGKV